MADRVTQVMVGTVLRDFGPEEAGPFLRQFIQTGLFPSLRRSGLSFRLARPVREPSLFAFATTDLASVWKSSILEVRPGETLAIPRDAADAMGICILQGFAIGFNSVPSLQQDRFWAIASSWGEHAGKWCKHFPEDAEETEAEASSQEIDKPDVPQTLPDLWRSILSVDQEAQGSVLQRVRFAIGMAILKPDDVAWLIEDGSWYDSVFQSLPLERFDLLMACILELLRVGNEEWKVKLPHMLRGQAQRADLPSERRHSAATMTLHACVIAGRVGALVSLTNSIDSADLRDKISRWWTQINEIRQISPCPVQGRLRDILAHLPPTVPTVDNASPLSQEQTVD
jgi:hypothetical protein